jgi:hypothetical protein
MTNTNIELTYNYTLDSIKVVEEGISKIKAKLIAVLTLSGVLVNFGKDLPGYTTEVECGSVAPPCLSCYILKITAYLLFVAALSLGLWGLNPATEGKIVLPKQLLTDEWNLASKEDYMTSLVEYLETETFLKLYELRRIKAIRLEWSIRCVAFGALLLGLDEMLATSLPILCSS